MGTCSEKRKVGMKDAKNRYITLGSIAIITYCNLNKMLFGLFVYFFYINKLKLL